MEELMHYIWKHRLIPEMGLMTNDGRKIRVIDPGLHNTDAGPDFFNAKVEIDGTMWVGNVEMHVRASDWRRHGHDKDKAYDNVVLHVVQKDDAPTYTTAGELIPQMVLEVSPLFYDRYTDLTGSKEELPCSQKLPSIPSLVITEWIQALAFERLHDKVERLNRLSELTSGNREEVCYITLARTLGFGLNGDAMERLARATPLRLLHKHSDSLQQLEALLLGQAGLLGGTDSTDVYQRTLAREYAFLRNKFSLTPMEASSWRLFRIRPQSFPYRRIALLAQFVCGGFNLLRQIIETKDEEALRDLFHVELTGYWTNHYCFGAASAVSSQALSEASVNIVLINTVAPLLYAHAEATGDFDMSDRAIALLESLPPERNAVTRLFEQAGIICDDALTSQALIQLRRNYCETRKCIYCRIGHRLLAKAATTP